MKHYQSLTRTSEKLIGFLEEYRKSNHSVAFEDIEVLFQAIQNIFPQWILMSCPSKHTMFRFITENCNNILGFSRQVYKATPSGDFLFSRIHEDDIEALQKCFEYINEFFKNSLPADYPKMRCVFHYRFRKPDGTYIILHDEKLMLTLNENDNLFYCMVRDVTDEMVFSGVKVDIFKHDTTTEKVGSFRPGEKQNNLSRRETEVINLLKRGLTTKEMAYLLNISHNTIRNMKQKMFEKYNVNNVVELLNRTMHYTSN